MTSELAQLCASICPGFQPGVRMRARKSELLAGELDGRPVVAKRLARPDPVWAWYLERELAIYRAFEASPPPFRVPRLVAAAHGVLVLERLPGPPLARLRRPELPLEPADLAAILALVDQLRSTTLATSPPPPPPSIERRLRARLLEDPSPPHAWIRLGVERCAARGILAPALADPILGALDAYPILAPCHGDLLLRNVVRDGARLGFVDWECAGTHHADWDLALVWIQLAPAARAPLEAAVATSAARHRAFLALAAFALAREVSFLRAFRAAPSHPALGRLRDELGLLARALTA